MQNLAGHPNATALCAQELTRAGIPTVPVPPAKAGAAREVGSQVAGRLGSFTFERAWYYWVVSGPMPLEVARRLYEDPVGREAVRVAGHCGCPPPDEWAVWRDPSGARLWSDPDGSCERRFRALVARHPRLQDPTDPDRFSADPASEPGARAFVESYHVDTAEGLRLLADAIRSLEQPAAVAEAA